MNIFTQNNSQESYPTRIKQILNLFTQNNSQEPYLIRIKQHRAIISWRKLFLSNLSFTWHAASIASTPSLFHSLHRKYIECDLFLSTGNSFWYPHPGNNKEIHTLSNSPKPKVKVIRISFSKFHFSKSALSTLTRKWGTTIAKLKTRTTRIIDQIKQE